MDGYKRPKKNRYKGELYSDTRYAVIKFIERELPKLKGRVLEVSAGNWLLPRKLLNMKKVTQYISSDIKKYGDSINSVQVKSDVHNLKFPHEYADAIICIEAFECYHHPHLAAAEMYRVLKKDGVLILTAPFNHAFFGRGGTPESLKKRNPVNDYWRITKNGWELLLKDFAKLTIEHSGPNSWDPFGYHIKAVK